MSGKFDHAAEVAAANEIARLRAINADLVEALKVARHAVWASWNANHYDETEAVLKKIDATIAKAKP
jgi:hypothetical protein